MDFSSAGAWDGVKHGFTVALYVAISGALVSLGQYLSGITVTGHQAVFAALIVVANAIIAGAERWLSTKEQV